MASEYFSSIDYLAQKRYLEKLIVESETLPDPYGIGELWSDDMSLWPDLQYGDIYTYLIESKGQFTRENLRAYKSLEAYNYFYNGHVRTVYCHLFGRYIIMKAKVNPSQKRILMKPTQHGLLSTRPLLKLKLDTVTVKLGKLYCCICDAIKLCIY